MSQVLVGEGTLLQLKISTVYTLVGQRVSLDGPETTVEAVETTNLDSITKKYRASEVPDGGVLSGTLQYDPADTVHLAMVALLPSAAQRTIPLWQLVFNNGSTTSRPGKTFPGLLKKFKPTGMEVEGNLEAEFEIQLTDLPVDVTVTATFH